jgi:hypothetical protein
VHVAIEGEDAAAASAAGRTLGGVDAPAVLVIAGARGPKLDELLRAQDLVLVAARGEEAGSAAGLAVARLAALDVPVVRCAVPLGAARRLAALGASVPEAIRTLVDDHVPSRAAAGRAGERGQATILVLAILLAVALAAVVLGGVARGTGATGEHQSAADLAALAGARAMHDAFGRLFEPAAEGGQPNPRHLELAEYEALARRAATETARRNGAHDVRVAFPDADTFAPVRIRVSVEDPITVADRKLPAVLSAEAELAPPATATVPASVDGGEYRGPFEQRQGKPMRPDVARAFDRMDAAARADGVGLIINSAWRSNAEQAALFAQHPDPKWVAPPGHSLHRLGTELDLGPASAYAWLARNAGRFGFVKRYSWEPWHFGYGRNPGSASVGFGVRGGDGRATAAVQAFVPARYAQIIARAAQRWQVSAQLLAAQLYAESNFNPFAQSGAGAQGIAQFIPSTARAYGVRDPFDAIDAIDGQAHLMHDLLARFAAVPLALAAYNAGPAPVAACGCVPANGETRGYVARILGLMGGAGDPTGSGLEVRLVR